MGVLVDTSVWVAHFRDRNESLVQLLEKDAVLCHSMVIAELACGTPPAPRQRTLQSMGLLRPAVEANLHEVVDWVEREKLFGLGCGFVDMSLLASSLMTPEARIWTLDKRLDRLARRFAVSHESAL